jgi:cell surface protein SprA
VVFNGSFKNYGFGGVQSKISERSRDNLYEIGLTANLNLDKFLPLQWGFQIPFYISYDKRNIAPQFDPLDPDIFLTNSLGKFSSESKKQEYLKLVQDKTERHGFNFSNVRKVRSALAKHAYLWDLSNFSFSYAYSEMMRSSTLIDSYTQLSQRGSILYAYTSNSNFWEPFAKMNSDSPWLLLFKDMNVNLVPTSLTVRAEMDRSFIRTQLRNGELTTLGVAPQFEKY